MVNLYQQTLFLNTVQAIYHKRFNFNNFPHKFQITHWLNKFKETGTLIKSTKKGQLPANGRNVTARLPENVDAVWDSVPRILEKSIRRCSQELGLSCSSFHRISKNDFQLYPCRIQIKQTLTQNEMAKHVEMCWCFESKIEELSDFLHSVWFSDEAVAITINCGTSDKNGNLKKVLMNYSEQVKRRRFTSLLSLLALVQVYFSQ